MKGKKQPELPLKPKEIIIVNKKPPNPDAPAWLFVLVLLSVSYFVFYLSKKIRRLIESEEDGSYFKQTSHVGKAR